MGKMKMVNVELPGSVAAILKAAGGDKPITGMPFAMASILGALPWIGVAPYKAMPEAEYRKFARQVRLNMDQAWDIIGAENPPAAFGAAYELAKRQVH